MPFLTDLVVKPIRGTSMRELQSALEYESNDGYVYTVGRGFITDYASIPKMLRAWIDQDSGYIREAAVLHDYFRFTPRVDRRQGDASGP